jgi:hypothetical protein
MTVSFPFLRTTFTAFAFSQRPVFPARVFGAFFLVRDLRLRFLVICLRLVLHWSCSTLKFFRYIQQVTFTRPRTGTYSE